ncbi:YidC/Oxa1 family membrane protein insertase [Liberiplasma polymorphum]|uniref:YidC/Oxa1 family membrane protein insertase n=1 Tax=Liberiplasma polymorphum TaxID=3374570 RepID=UPI003773CAF7
MKNYKKLVLVVVLLLVVTTLSGCNTAHYEMGIGEGGGFTWVQWIVARVADLIYVVSMLAGGYYAVGLIIITLLIRILGWPIYSKSTALSTNMQIAQPELEKLKQKYQGKTDPASQRAQQQEMMQIYKEYGINPLGCLLPLLQMPIFIAMYQTVRRIPLTPRFTENLNFNFLWFSFTDEPVTPWYSLQNTTFIVLAFIVGATMFGYQKYAMTKPEALQNRKYRTAQQEQSEKTMKYMMYFMTFMLVFIAFTSLGIAFYWIIGNLFQFVQTYVNRKQTIQRLEAKKSKI